MRIVGARSSERTLHGFRLGYRASGYAACWIDPTPSIDVCGYLFLQFNQLLVGRKPRHFGADLYDRIWTRNMRQNRLAFRNLKVEFLVASGMYLYARSQAVTSSLWNNSHPRSRRIHTSMRPNCSLPASFTRRIGVESSSSRRMLRFRNSYESVSNQNAPSAITTKRSSERPRVLPSQ